MHWFGNYFSNTNAKQVVCWFMFFYSDNNIVSIRKRRCIPDTWRTQYRVIDDTVLIHKETVILLLAVFRQF